MPPTIESTSYQGLSHSEPSYSSSIIDEYDDDAHPDRRKNLRLTNYRKTLEPFVERLGTVWALAIVATIVCLLLSAGFISWMWWSSPTQTVWQRLMLSKFGIRSITVTAIVIRTAVASQAAIATSMIASIVLEHHRGALMEDAAFLSIARFEATPLSLKRLITGSSKDRVPFYIQLLITCLLITALGSQFSSTLLLSDMALGRVSSSPQLSTARLNFLSRFEDKAQVFDSDRSMDPIKTKPTQFETFAEYSERPDESLIERGIDDTGVSLRALLPISSQKQREGMIEFEGPAKVFDARVVCFRPEIRNLRLCSDSDKIASARRTSIDICGEIRPENASLVPDLVIMTNGSVLPELVPSSFVSFDCPLTPPRISGATGVELCTITHGVREENILGLIPSIDPLHGKTSSYSRTEFGVRSGRSYIIWKSFGLPTYPQLLQFETGSLNFTSDIKKDKQWLLNMAKLNAKHRVGDDGIANSSNIDFRADVGLSTSICVDAFMPFDTPVTEFHIKASSPTHRTEPSLGHVSESDMFDTKAIRAQIGATKSTLSSSSEDRGILDLAIDSLRIQIQSVRERELNLSGIDVFEYAGSDFLTARASKTLGLLDSGNINLCVNCPQLDVVRTKGAIKTGITPGLVLSSIFNDTLVETGSLAHAFQAFRTVLVRMIYYDAIGSFTSQPETISTTMALERTIPTQKIGYWIVLGILGLHLATFVTVVFIFLTTTRWSRVGNAWMAIAQVGKSLEMDEIMGFAQMASDREVRDRIRGDGRDSNGEGMRKRRYQIAEGGKMIVTSKVVDSESETTPV